MAQLWLPPSAHAKAKPPRTGPAFGNWAGREPYAFNLPGGGALQFNLDLLTLADFRGMRNHYQVNISLAALTFLMHQMDWHIECEDKKIATACEEGMRSKWTQLVRAIPSQAYWAGFSPTVIEWKNDNHTGRIEIANFKDLLPEECTVNWKTVDGYAPPGGTPQKLKVYDGIRQASYGGYGSLGQLTGRYGVIPPENTVWYPFMMENGDHYGRKVLKPAFPAWFFSQLIHLYANRYFERFGEPLPIGRAPFEDNVTASDGTTMNGREVMENVLSGIRNRSVVVLPNAINEEAQNQSTGKANYDYEIEYLESQMRGADFERYLGRLDEEISLALFTPLLMTRTSDVGSYNLGVGHMQMYLWFHNALAGDFGQYINSFVLDRYVDYNFSPKAPRARWVFKKGGKHDAETLRAIVSGLITSGTLGFNLEELGGALGLGLKEVKLLAPAVAPGTPTKDGRAGRVKDAPKTKPRGTEKTRSTTKAIANRIAGQITRAYRAGVAAPAFSLGYQRQLLDAIVEDGGSATIDQLAWLYSSMSSWLLDYVSLGEAYISFDELVGRFEELLNDRVDEFVAV